MVYADEDFYKNKYLLGRKAAISSGFPFYARQASQIMDQYTFGRLTIMEDVPEEAKLCCCELAEVIYRQEKTEKMHPERLLKRSELIRLPMDLRRN